MSSYSNIMFEAGADNKALFKSIHGLLYRKSIKRLSSGFLPHNFANTCINFFKEKIISIRSHLQVVFDTPEYFFSLDTPTLYYQLYIFLPAAIQELSKIAPWVFSKFCCLDPLPAFLDQFETLLPVIWKIINLSLEYLRDVYQRHWQLLFYRL